MADKYLGTSPLCFGIMAELVGVCNVQLMVDAACQTIEAAGHETLVISSGHDAQSELTAWTVLSRVDVQGIIIHSDHLSNDQLARIKSTRPNVVFAQIDHFQAGKLAAAQLMALGHRQIAMVAEPSNRYSAQLRSRGFIEQINALSDEDCEMRTINTRAVKPEAGADAMHTILTEFPACTAVLFHHGHLTAGGLQACKKAGIKVPEDISILTCCQNPPPPHLEETLSVVSHPLDKIGQFAAEQVMKLNGNRTPPYTSNAVWPSPFVDLNTTTVPRSTAGELTAHSSEDTQAEDDPSSKCSLSGRERECLEWAARGKTSWETSQILGVTESTVIYHLRNATRKLNAANRLHAVTKALKASLIEF